MKRSPQLLALCMHNLASALKNGTVSGSLAAQSLDSLAEEVNEFDRPDLDEDPSAIIRPEDSAQILKVIRGDK